MKTLADSLAGHVSGLDQEAFERLVLARPGLAQQLGLDSRDEEEVTVGEVVNALLDEDLVFMAVAGLSLPCLQVLAVLAAESDSTPMKEGPAPGRLDLRSLRGLSGGFGGGLDDMLLRLGVLSGAVARHIDAGAVAAAVCGTDAGMRGRFDGIVASLIDVALMWPEGGRLRLHDEVFAMPDILAAAEPWNGDGFAMDPPRLDGVRIAGVDVGAAAQAAALGALEESARFYGLVAAEPVPLLKAGGVGAREMKRLGKVLGLDAERLRFWLHLGESAGLIDADGGTLLASEAFDEWAAAEPAERYAVLVAGWLDMAAFPRSSAGDGGRPPAPLSDDAYCGPAPLVRAAVLRGLRSVPEEHAPSVAALVDQARWSVPVVVGFGREGDGVACSCGEVHDEGSGALGVDPDAAIAAVLAEGEILGAVVSGVLTSAFRFESSDYADARLLDGMLAVMGSVLPEAVTTVRIQGDLTAIAGGLPGAALSALMDSCARRESSGAAVVWRFSDGSIRAYLDGGGDAEDLLKALKAHCAGGVLPQALEYLIRDAGRVHGRVDVVNAGSVLVTADATLADEIEANAALAALGSRRVAPTVLVCACEPLTALNALRFAGYAPSAHEADGAVSVGIARGTRPRAGLAGRRTL